MKEKQMSLFQDMAPTNEELSNDIEKLKKEIQNLRRGLFQRYSQLQFDMATLNTDFQLLLEKLEDHRNGHERIKEEIHGESESKT